MAFCKELNYSYVKCAPTVPDVECANLIVPLGQIKQYLEASVYYA